MGEYQDTHIFDTVDEINHKYFLPHIQRSFVWKEDQIIRLFDSLLRGYPIGTFLFWVDKSGDVRKRKFIENYYKKYSKDFNIEKMGLEDTSQSRDVTLVLDGQQRLQSLFIAIKGKYEDKELYINLLSGEKENEDGILYEFKFFKIPTDNDRKALWIKVKDIVNKFNKKGVLVSDVKRELLHSMNVDTIKEGIIEKNLERLKNAFISDRRLSYYDEKEENYEKVFDIFVRVNSGGTPLSKSDLLFSFIKLKWETFEAEKEFPNLLEGINSNEQFEFDVDFILKTSLVLIDFPVKYAVKTFTGEKGKEISKKIESNWGSINEKISTVIDLIRDNFKINNKKLLPSNNALIPLIYYSFKKNKKSISDFDEDDKKIIKNWLLNILLSGTFSGQSDNFLEKARKIIDENISFDKFPAKAINAEFESLRKITEVNEAILGEISYRTTQSCLLLYLIYPYGVNFKPSNNANYPQQDHIFSINELETFGYAASEINRIGNIRLVTSCANKRKLATPYKNWIETESPDEIKLTLIPDKPESWNLTNYKSFVEKREQMILEKVKKAL